MSIDQFTTPRQNNSGRSQKSAPDSQSNIHADHRDKLNGKSQPSSVLEEALSVVQNASRGLVAPEVSKNTATAKDPFAEIGGFVDLDLTHGVLRAIAKLGYKEPSDIQKQVIPLMLSGYDVVGQSQTGTGKTCAFGAPIASMLDPEELSVQALILVPTRELCMQVAGEMAKLSAPRKLGVVPVYGGKPINVQSNAIASGAQIVVGTPGRLLDLIGRGLLDLSSISVVVLDECDEMLDIGFADDIDRILSYTPNPRQTSLFSATLPPFVLTLIERYLTEPQFVQVRPDHATVDEIEQVYVEVLEKDKIRAIRRLLNHEHQHSRLLVFRNTQRGVDWLVRRLETVAIRAEGIHGGMTQDQREKTMRGFREGSIQILVATNVAARGLDIKDVSHVVNYDIPSTPDEYVHRIGRTGRAGQSGKAVTFVAEWDLDLFDAIRARVGNGIQPLELGLQ